MYTRIIAVNLALTSILLSLSPARADIPSKLEPEYSEAVLAFNGRKYDHALKLLDELLKKAPNAVEFMELKALTLKTHKRSAESVKVYRALIAEKRKQKRPPAESAPYYFELGVMEFQDQKNKEAKADLNEAIEHKFNVGAAHFFLGMLHFKDGEWETSEEHFHGVLSSNADDLKAPSHFYLAQVYLKMKYPSGATQNFSAARDRAKDTLDDKSISDENKGIAKQIFEASEKALAPLDRSQYFGSVALLSSFDSNVLAVPDTATGTSASGKSSLKQVLQAGIGYMSSPLRTFQWVPNYRLAYNFNFNSAAQTGEFLTNVASLYVTRKPLDRTNFGLKLEGNYTLQNSGTSRFGFGGYSFSTNFGPYFKTEIKPKLVLGVQATYGTRKYFTDSASTTSTNRTGTGLSARIYLQNDTGSRYWNPTVSLSGGNESTEGTEYASKSLGLSLSNLVPIGQLSTLSAGPSITITHYPTSQYGSRVDRNYALNVSFTHKLGAKWTLLADASYAKNDSTVASAYTYSRFVVSAGASYSFF
ncbi:MAG: tetratricopeptide repeat protein [Bacteriovoracia bacterium]